LPTVGSTVKEPGSADVFHAVADTTRRAILNCLRDHGKAVGEIARGFAVSRPAISKHLRVLAKAKLVVEQREGRRRIYRLNAGPLREVDRWLEEYRRFWEVSLANLKKHVENKGKTQ
jgi:DNA-binding transcriptional ArsR family regulator